MFTSKPVKGTYQKIVYFMWPFAFSSNSSQNVIKIVKMSLFIHSANVHRCVDLSPKLLGKGKEETEE